MCVWKCKCVFVRKCKYVFESVNVCLKVQMCVWKCKCVFVERTFRKVSWESRALGKGCGFACMNLIMKVPTLSNRSSWSVSWTFLPSILSRAIFSLYNDLVLIFTRSCWILHCSSFSGSSPCTQYFKSAHTSANIVL